MIMILRVETVALALHEYVCMCGDDKEDIEITLEVPKKLEFVDANGFCKSR